MCVLCVFHKAVDVVRRSGVVRSLPAHHAVWSSPALLFRCGLSGWIWVSDFGAAVAVHLASVLHASRSPPPLPPRRPSAHLLMQSSISGELCVGPEGREVGHSCYANARRDRGRYGPSGGGTHTGPLSSRDQHAAAVRGNRAAHVCLCLQEWLLIGISTMER